MTYVEFNGLKCIQPDSIIRSLLKGRAGDPKPNCYRSSWGTEPGMGWILLSSVEVDSLDLTFNGYQLKFFSTHGEITIKDLMIVHIESVHATPSPDESDVMLVKVCDARIYDRLTTIDKHYNMVRKSYMDDTNKRFVTAADEIQDGTDIIKDIIGELPTALFPSPITEDIGVSYTEVEYPENLDFQHVPGWSAACEVAHRVGLELTYNKEGDIILFAPYHLSSADAEALLNAQTAYRLQTTRPGNLEVMRYPEKFRVLFRKAFTDVVGNTDTRVWGNDEAHEFDSYYAVDVTTNDILTLDVFPGTMLTIQHDRVIVDRDFVTTTYDTIAEEFVTSYVYQMQGRNNNDIVSFSGFIDFPFQVFQSVEYQEQGNGPYTLVRRGVPKILASHYSHPFPQRMTFGFGQVTTASTKYDRSTKAVSTDGRLKPIQRDGDDTLDDSSTKEIEVISFSDYPIKAGQNMLWVTDTNSMRAVAIPIGLQTNKPLFIEFEIDTGLTSPLNGTMTQQFWGPTQSGSDLNVELVCSDDSSANPQYDLTTDGAIGLAFLREDGKYHVFDLEC